MKMRVALSMAMLVALAQGDNDCKNAVSRGIVGRPCGNDIVTVKDHRRLGLPKTAASKCNVDGKCVNDAIYVTLGNGCFWCVSSRRVCTISVCVKCLRLSLSA